MRMTQWMCGLAVAVALLPLSARGNELLAGGTATPDAFSLGYSDGPPSGPNRTVLASKFGTWGSGSSTGQFFEQVEADPGNIFCAGCLDFLFQVSLDYGSSPNLVRVEETGFTGYRTDVGYDTLSLGDTVLCGIDDNGFCNNGDPATAPNAVDRSASGDIVGFNLPGVIPGENTVDLVIQTDATSFTDPLATFYLADGNSFTAQISGPSGPPVSSSMPEPSSLAGLLGLVGVGVIRRCRRA